MNFNQLQYVVKIVENKSISRAAQELLVTQPYLSGLVKSLEKELGFNIFKRTQLGIELTENGEEFFHISKRILSDLDSLKKIKLTKDLSMLVSMIYCNFFMECFLEFKELEELNFNDRIYEMSNSECFKFMMEKKTNLSLISYVTSKREKYFNIANQHNIECFDIIERSPLRAIMSPNHALSSRSSISKEDLTHVPFVIYDKQDFLSLLDILDLKNHPNLLFVSDRGSFISAVTSGKYISVSTKILTGDKDIIFVPLSDNNLTLDIAYAKHKDYKLNQREKNFMNFIKQKTSILITY